MKHQVCLQELIIRIRIIAAHSKSGDSPYRLDRYATLPTSIKSRVFNHITDTCNKLQLLSSSSILYVMKLRGFLYILDLGYDCRCACSNIEDIRMKLYAQQTMYVNVSPELFGMFANDLETGMLQNITAQGDSYHDHKQDMIG